MAISSEKENVEDLIQDTLNPSYMVICTLLSFPAPPIGLIPARYRRFGNLSSADWTGMKPSLLGLELGIPSE